ncbi:hypothetical protein OHA37_39360 [Streptomyces sp. NBC_00335]|uniref:hypothetical protein n=1 Tax=unclassified Streptomyces TaxID=2593676 RepID=UPI00224E3968|nr:MULTISPECIES: hypothetical protein [unclassified Streptomyces]MCX5409887.1 hypothetical protein [Streptomyces sp. NBC_00086]
MGRGPAGGPNGTEGVRAPGAELSLLLALAHAAQDDDEDDRAEEVYRDALEVFPDHLGLLAGYAELCLRSDFQDRPARKTRGPALAARVAEPAPDSPEALRVARGCGGPGSLPTEHGPSGSAGCCAAPGAGASWPLPHIRCRRKRGCPSWRPYRRIRPASWHSAWPGRRWR